MMRFDRFTERAQEAAQRAAEIIQRYGHNQIDTEHILLALIEQPGGVIPQILEKLSVSPEALTERLDATLRASPKANIFGGGAGQIFITPRVKRIIDLANEEANRLKDEYISTEHLFLGILGRDPGHPRPGVGADVVVLEPVVLVRPRALGQDLRAPGGGLRVEHPWVQDQPGVRVAHDQPGLVPVEGVDAADVLAVDADERRQAPGACGRLRRCRSVAYGSFLRDVRNNAAMPSALPARIMSRSAGYARSPRRPRAGVRGSEVANSAPRPRRSEHEPRRRAGSPR